MDIEIPIGAMDVRMNVQFNKLLCEDTNLQQLRSTRTIDTRPVD